MSIWQELKDLETYTNSVIGYNSWFGDREPASDELPVIRYLTSPGENFELNTKSSITNIDVNAQIIVKKENELKAWEVYENWLKKIKQYNDEHGHILKLEYEIERDDTHLKIIPTIIINMIAQDTE